MAVNAEQIYTSKYLGVTLGNIQVAPNLTMERISVDVEVRHLVEMNIDRQAVARSDKRAAENVTNCACKKFSEVRLFVGI
ncbi:hypothetical protein GJQ69_03980 [Caproicibacterium lactatifermentans]|jgi:hypothetical protein|uniref:Uncharacterized protein n=1 Tax=Caproicibacterium lactatifermentans TaxID=2666138 RepID=A0A859DNW1_9FIRM|nr:hypothetical protein GJQ69_03980 [Caproicibacterium lactatifermentans]